MFTAREYEPESGLYYNRARYLDPASGAFIQEEPFKTDGPNLYYYALNNPMRFHDPDGFAATGEIIGAGIGGVLGGYSGGIIGLGGGFSAGTLLVPGVGSVALGLTGAETGQIVGAALGSAVGRIVGGNIEDFINYSKGGKQNARDSGLESIPTDEINRRARDKSLPPNERGRYIREEKARRERNKRKRCQ